MQSDSHLSVIPFILKGTEWPVPVVILFLNVMLKERKSRLWDDGVQANKYHLFHYNMHKQ